MTNPTHKTSTPRYLTSQSDPLAQEWETSTDPFAIIDALVDPAQHHLAISKLEKSDAAVEALVKHALWEAGVEKGFAENPRAKPWRRPASTEGDVNREKPSGDGSAFDDFLVKSLEDTRKDVQRSWLKTATDLKPSLLSAHPGDGESSPTDPKPLRGAAKPDTHPNTAGSLSEDALKLLQMGAVKVKVKADKTLSEPEGQSGSTANGGPWLTGGVDPRLLLGGASDGAANAGPRLADALERIAALTAGVTVPGGKSAESQTEREAAFTANPGGKSTGAQEGRESASTGSEEAEADVMAAVFERLQQSSQTAEKAIEETLSQLRHHAAPHHASSGAQQTKPDPRTEAGSAANPKSARTTMLAIAEAENPVSVSVGRKGGMRAGGDNPSRNPNAEALLAMSNPSDPLADVLAKVETLMAAALVEANASDSLSPTSGGHRTSATASLHALNTALSDADRLMSAAMSKGESGDDNDPDVATAHRPRNRAGTLSGMAPKHDNLTLQVQPHTKARTMKRKRALDPANSDRGELTLPARAVRLTDITTAEAPACTGVNGMRLRLLGPYAPVRRRGAVVLPLLTVFETAAVHTAFANIPAQYISSDGDVMSNVTCAFEEARTEDGLGLSSADVFCPVGPVRGLTQAAAIAVGGGDCPPLDLPAGALQVAARLQAENASAPADVGRENARLDALNSAAGLETLHNTGVCLGSVDYRRADPLRLLQWFAYHVDVLGVDHVFTYVADLDALSPVHAAILRHYQRGGHATVVDWAQVHGMDLDAETFNAEASDRAGSGELRRRRLGDASMVIGRGTSQTAGTQQKAAGAVVTAPAAKGDGADVGPTDLAASRIGTARSAVWNGTQAGVSNAPVVGIVQRMQQADCLNRFRYAARYLMYFGADDFLLPEVPAGDVRSVTRAWAASPTYKSEHSYVW